MAIDHAGWSIACIALQGHKQAPELLFVLPDERGQSPLSNHQSYAAQSLIASGDSQM